MRAEFIELVLAAEGHALRLRDAEDHDTRAAPEASAAVVLEVESPVGRLPRAPA